MDNNKSNTGQSPDEEQWTDVCHNCVELEKRIVELEKQVSLLSSQLSAAETSLTSSTRTLQEQNLQLIDRLNKLEQRMEPSLFSSVIAYIQSFFQTGRHSLENASGTCCSTTTQTAIEPFDLQEHASPSHIADLIQEQSFLERDLLEFHEANRVPETLDNLKENDIVETITDEALNFSDTFQYSRVLDQIESIPYILLAARYYFPCVVTSVTDDEVALHYFGYESNWDFTLTKSQFAKRLRPLPILSREENRKFEVGEDVEVRLLQRTCVDDDYTKQAYCWVMGKILSLDDKSALVKITLDCKSHGIDSLVVGNSNKFTMKGKYGGHLGFERVKVCLQAVRKLEKPYPE